MTAPSRRDEASENNKNPNSPSTRGSATGGGSEGKRRERDCTRKGRLRLRRPVPGRDRDRDRGRGGRGRGAQVTGSSKKKLPLVERNALDARRRHLRPLPVALSLLLRAAAAGVLAGVQGRAGQGRAGRGKAGPGQAGLGEGGAGVEGSARALMELALVLWRAWSSRASRRSGSARSRTRAGQIFFPLFLDVLSVCIGSVLNLLRGVLNACRHFARGVNRERERGREAAAAAEDAGRQGLGREAGEGGREGREQQRARAGVDQGVVGRGCRTEGFGGIEWRAARHSGGLG
ncbi:hypothetical protein Mp_4g05110 [Marchantia polymorpha subsp. ruderalis]|uniref:Uncharacterized protein n=2 Tax=Marchantia polymorpha TaxID=3197 RepID=A0AAF6B6J0_MARPO|nr:hypothetical protein MARPO_0087s0078 [Marchantia polymorpha]BBN07624.1 hypothetical protein Mp_4g05110 [Marchantia polymorpha subsp. ruderalis]|eukprot:PTQ33648.1 hypothetical protein MARPO_0087s0078 [Marchantia polymorpha]